jgi:hypothetical protein
MLNDFKHGDTVRLNKRPAVFLHKSGQDKAFVRLCDNHELKKVDLSELEKPSK